MDITCSESDSVRRDLGEKQVQADIATQGHGRPGSEIGDMHGTCFSAGKTWEPRQRGAAFAAFSLFSLEHILQTC